ncbi:MAG: hypothetical protein ACI3YH_03195 [Eubacteriales bacterium]
MKNISDTKRDELLLEMSEQANYSKAINPEEGVLPHEAPKPTVGKKEIEEAVKKLKEYAAAKEPLDQRIIEEERWWRLRHWEYLRQKSSGIAGSQDGKEKKPKPEPVSAWLFNAIANKHADMKDNYPVPALLPRERADEEDSKVLSAIVPVVMERGHFRDVFDESTWYYLQHGMVAYGTFWDNSLENGLGDVQVNSVDILRIFWEPMIEDIQQSENLFICELVDTDALKAQYPHIPEEVFGKQPIRMGQYIYDDFRAGMDEGKKTLVIDWYRKKNVDGKTVLCFTKFIGESEEGILFSSENDDRYAGGWYADGEYPIDIARLYPVPGTPAGFGMIAIGKDPQMYIDRMDQNFIINMDEASRNRWWGKQDLGIDVKQFNDLDCSIVEVAGNISEERLQQIKVAPLDSIYYNMKQYKIEEMKETLSNRDVSQGSPAGGVTAASAIAALQEAGNKVSRDMIATYYSAYERIIAKVVERIRQFYTEEREFRITGQTGYDFVRYSNRGISEQQVGTAPDGSALYRRPIFDIKISAQRRSPFSQLAQNEVAKELYGLGAFNPEMAQMVLPMLEMMEFEGKEKVLAYVQQGQTLFNQLQQMKEQMAMMAAELTGQPVGGGAQTGSPTTPNVDSVKADSSAERSPIGRVYDTAENLSTGVTA